MVSTVVFASAQAKAATASVAKAAPKPASALKALPRQAGQAAALVVAHAGLASAALADLEVSLPPVDVSAASDVASIFADNPFLIGAGAALVAIPLGITALLKSAPGAGPKATTPDRALTALAEDARVVLVDIRAKAEIKAQGSPDLRPVKRSAVSLPLYSIVKGEVVVDDAWTEKFAGLKAIDEESLVILLDADGTAAKKAAAAVADAVEKVYFVQGGAAAWAETAPWRAPSAGLSLSLPNLKNVGASLNELADDFKAAPSLAKAGLAAGALAGAGFLLANEIEIILELAGLVAAGQFLLKLVFAEEREKTLTEIKTLVDEKVALSEVGSDLNKIAKAVLEDVEPSAAPKKAAPAPAPAAAAPAPVAASNGNGAESEAAKEAKEWIENWKEKSSA